jgi:hypothetical protein
MEPHSILQEHTLVLAGEEVQSGTVWQGWPNRSQVALKEHRQHVNAILDKVSTLRRHELRSQPSFAVKPTRALSPSVSVYGAVDEEAHVILSTQNDSIVRKNSSKLLLAERQPLLPK